MKTAFVIFNTKTHEYFSSETVYGNFFGSVEFSSYLKDAKLYGTKEEAAEMLIDLFWGDPAMEIQEIGHIKNLKK